jgi:hypothetical protein
MIQLDALTERFDELLEGFKIYNEYKGTLDIVVYEKSLELFGKAIAAMEEQCEVLHEVVDQLKLIINEL